MCRASDLDELTDRPRGGVELVQGDGPTRLRVAGKVTTAPIRPNLIDVDQRLERMDRQGVDVQLVSPFVDTTAYALQGDDAVAYARRYNTAIAEVVAAHPGRFLGLANIPLSEPDAAAAALTHAMNELEMVGCEIATTVDGQDLDGVDLDPFWASAEELGALVLLHPYASLAGRGVARYFLGNLVGNLAETTIAVAHLILSGVLERFPEPAPVRRPRRRVPALPARPARPRVPREARRRRDAAHASPGEYTARLLDDTITHAPPVLRYLVDLVGASQVVLGSDHPFEMGDPDPVARLDAVPGLSADERALILTGNVERLLSAPR